MEKKIQIKSSKTKIFRQYADVLNFLLKIRPKELDVLAKLLEYNDKLKHIEEEHRWKIILDYDTKKEMQASLEMSNAYFDNCITVLRKKGILINNKIMDKPLY